MVVDYAALAKKHGAVTSAPSGVSYDELAKKHGEVITPPAPSPAPADPSTFGDHATFPAAETDNPVEIAAKVIGNLPASAVHFAKSTFDFFNPLTHIKAGMSLDEALKQNEAQPAAGGHIIAPSIGDVAKEIPGQAAKLLVPQFIQHIAKGEFGKASETIVNDPVGQIAPLIMLAKQGADAMGKTNEFNNAISTAAKPVTKVVGGGTDAPLKAADLHLKTAEVIAENTPGIKPLELIKNTQKEIVAGLEGEGMTGASKAISKLNPSQFGSLAEFATKVREVVGPESLIGKAAGSVGSQILGMSTGTGASSIKTAFEGTPEFTQAMRGKITADEVVQDVHDAVSTIKQNRAAQYQEALAKIGEDTKTHDISPVVKSVNDSLQRFNIKVKEDGTLDFSRSSIAQNGSARADVQGVYDTVKDWGSQKGDRTGVGLDTLKRQLGDFYTDSGQARAFVQGVKASVQDILYKEVPGYQEMTRNYQNVGNLLDDIKSATGAGGNAKADTVFTKLTTAMKADKEFRLEVLKQIEATPGSSKLMDKIAGINMSSAIPRGLIGRGVDIGSAFSLLLGHFNPSFIPALLSTSPRIVGEFVRGMGLGAQKAADISNAIQKLAPVADYLTPAALGSTSQENQNPEQTPEDQ